MIFDFSEFAYQAPTILFPLSGWRLCFLALEYLNAIHQK